MRVEGGISVAGFQHNGTGQNTNNTVENSNMSPNRGEGNVEAINDVNLKRNMDQKDLQQAINDVNKSVKAYNRRLQYSVHEKTNTIMVKVIDTSEGRDEVIRELPPEKILDMVAKMWEMAGIIVDERV
ncbi:flagellar protein FlaG [Clostridiisalibacter paucivorans]|uniref:flagellar protein FlaG n=1 Tax=Clostridiisalibacter paucivorans TaxID=408753 RepID=UPI00047C82CF|nr:flagellar protein FlaG [Clostridiisalibacter paucivorans]